MNDSPTPLPANYGLHLLVDAAGANPETLADPALLRRVLYRLVELTGLRALGPPHLYPVDIPEIVGITGVILICTSHISIHTYAGRGWIAADVFSCSQFEVAPVIAYLVEAFGIQNPEQNVLSQAIQRGQNFPPRNIFTVTLAPDTEEPS